MKNHKGSKFMMAGLVALLSAGAAMEVSAQATAPAVRAPRPSTTTSTIPTEAVQLTTPQGKAIQVSGRTAFNTIAPRLGVSNERAAVLYRDWSVQIRNLEKEGKLSVTTARAAFVKLVNGEVTSKPNAAALSEEAFVAFNTALETETTGDMAEAIMGQTTEAGTSAAADSVAKVDCDLTNSMRAGLESLQGLHTRTADEASMEVIAYNAQLAEKVLKLATEIQEMRGLKSYEEVLVEAFTKINGQTVSFKVVGIVDALNSFISGSLKSEESTAVLEGLHGLLTVAKDVALGKGRTVKNNVIFTKLVFAELVNVLAEKMPREAALEIVYGRLLDPADVTAELKDKNGDGQINVEDGYVYGEVCASGAGICASGIAGHCPIPTMGVNIPS